MPSSAELLSRINYTYFVHLKNVFLSVCFIFQSCPFSCKLKLLVISKSFQGNSSQELVQCPICFKSVPKETIEQHADSCADSTSAEVLDIMSSQEETKRYLAM